MRFSLKVAVLATTAVTALIIAPTAASAATTTNTAASASAPAGAARDARAAAGATAGQMSPLASWFSGTLCANCSQNWFWNNAPADRIYVVGYSPVGASTSQACVFQTTKSWDVQEPGGEREFWFTVKNIGALACGADILLTAYTNGVGPWATGGLNPGGTTTKHWNNANPLTTSYAVGVAPSGATTVPCQMQVIKSWYQQQPGGEREFWFTVQNIGTIACQANILLAGDASTVIGNTGTIQVNGSTTWKWNNANPLNNVYTAGASPLGASATTACQFQVTSTWYEQVINPPAEREFFLTLKNVGGIACSAEILLAAAAA